MYDEVDDKEKEAKSPIRKLLYGSVVVFIIVGMLSSAIMAVDWFLSNRSGPATVVISTSEPPREDHGGNFAGEAPGDWPRAINRIVYITPEGHLATLDPDGSNDRLLTGSGLVFQFPAWSPDGRYLAAIGGNRSTQGVYLLADQAEQRAPRELYVNRRQTPFYLYWSPDSSQVSFLANHPTDVLGLHLAPIDGEEESRLLTTGSPLYWDWATSSDEILIHTGLSGEGSRLALITTTGDDLEQHIANPGFFQAPGISASGRYLAYAEAVGSNISRVVVADTQSDTRQQERHAGLVAMSWSPSSDHLAIISTIRDVGQFYGPLRLLDAQTGESSMLSGDLVLGFFWSPDGQYIATIAAPGSNDDLNASISPAQHSGLARLAKRAADQPSPLLFELGVVEVATGNHRYLDPFPPSQVFVTQYLPFFDQYALSHRLWSPNSDALVLPMHIEGEDRIVVVPINGDPPKTIAAGNMPSWSGQ